MRRSGNVEQGNPKVVVLMGGISFEREVSLSSGRECAAALRSEGYDVAELDAGPDVALRLSELRPDVVFNALHGRWGEDGCVQGILEWLKIPYTHSGFLPLHLPWTNRKAKLPIVPQGCLLLTAFLRIAEKYPKPSSGTALCGEAK